MSGMGLTVDQYTPRHIGVGPLGPTGQDPNHCRPDWSQYFLEADRTSVLICADSDRLEPSAADINRFAELVGHRVLDRVPIGAALERLATLVNVDVVIVACSGDEPNIEMLIARLDMMAEQQGVQLIVIVDLIGLDRVHALALSPNSVVLCQPRPEDVVVALMATWPSSGRHRLRDIGRESESSQIERLSDQLVRLSHTIEALLQNRGLEGFQASPIGGVERLRSPGRRYSAPVGEDSADDAPIAGSQIRALLRVRRLREHIIAPDLFADPAWDILLDLMAARLEHSRVSVSSLCIAAAVPPTTALRWIRQLTDRGLLQRQADPLDGRRIFIALSDEGAQVVLQWFRESRAQLQAALGQETKVPPKLSF